MRTKVQVAVAALLAAGALSSMAQSNVYSVNVVGYVNKQLVGGGKYTLIANPLNSSSNTLAPLLQATLPVGSKVMKWTGSGYATKNRVSFGNGWSPADGATTTLNPGEGAFIQLPGASADLTNTFVGDVLQGNLTNAYTATYTLSGNLVPDSGAVSGMQLTNAPLGAKLMKWNPTGGAGSGAYATYTRVTFGSGWSPSVPSIDVADGFFINTTTPFNWVRNFTVQ